MKEHFRMAFQSLKSNRLRSFLTMLGIIIGISSVITIMTIGDSLQGGIGKELSSFGATRIVVSVSEKQEEDEKDSKDRSMMMVSQEGIEPKDWISSYLIEEYEKNYANQIERVGLEKSMGMDEIKGKNGSLMTSIQATNAYTIPQYHLLQGRSFEKEDEDRPVVCITKNLYDVLFDGSEKIPSFPLSINGSFHKVYVVGVLEKEGHAAQFQDVGNVFLPIQTAKKWLHEDDGYDSFYVLCRPNVNVKEFTETTQTFFQQHYRGNPNYEITTTNMEDLVDSMFNVMNKVTLAISLIASISLLVGGIGVMNIMLVSVSERTKEIGIRKALGASRKTIQNQFLIEALILCLTGGLIGIAIGTSVGMLVAYELNFPARPSVHAIVLAVSLTMAIGVFFGYYPARIAAKKNPIDALRYE